MSLTVETGMFYTFIPAGRQLKLTGSGRLLPEEYDCHIRDELHSTLNQAHLKRRLTNKPERERTDVWWVEEDFSNTEYVAANIRDVFLSEGIPWFAHFNNADNAYEAIKAERDCLDKYWRAMHVAKHLNYSREFQYFEELARLEADRIGSRIPGVVD